MVKLSPVLGVLDNDISTGINIYPNPTQEILYIESQEPIETIKIYNLQGQLIREDSSNRIDVSQLNVGLYFLQATIDGKTITNKFIKK